MTTPQGTHDRSDPTSSAQPSIGEPSAIGSSNLITIAAPAPSSPVTTAGWFMLRVLVCALTFGLPYHYLQWNGSRTSTSLDSRSRHGKWYMLCRGRQSRQRSAARMPIARDSGANNADTDNVADNASMDWNDFDDQFATTWIVTNGTSMAFIGLGVTLLQIGDIATYGVTRTAALLGLLFAFASVICGCINYFHRKTLWSIWKGYRSSWLLKTQRNNDHSKLLLFWTLITLPTSLVIWSIVHLIGSILVYSTFAGQPQTAAPTVPVPLVYNILPLVVTLILTILLSIIYAIVLGGRRAFDSHDQEHIAIQHLSAAA
ncbi:hypothetical protein BDN72DRAFT_881666 [Pluteus cervinus]|uniref:Uncharacterized protein n=1 Tax=Pluteus cervinus TaxID=181527 RepID=A0ACD3AF11_9AGAR|nr:hypothetical protein BDN72DRAFT_881666 [Pluteus cervinus]